jgi:hypothetical protein
MNLLLEFNRWKIHQPQRLLSKLHVLNHNNLDHSLLLNLLLNLLQLQLQKLLQFQLPHLLNKVEVVVVSLLQVLSFLQTWSATLEPPLTLLDPVCPFPELPILIKTVCPSTIPSERCWAYDPWPSTNKPRMSLSELLMIWLEEGHLNTLVLVALEKICSWPLLVMLLVWMLHVLLPLLHGSTNTDFTMVNLLAEATLKAMGITLK